MKKRFIIALCCLVLLMQLLPIIPMAETVGQETADKGTVSQDLYYCRTELAKLPNSAALVSAYDAIVEGINKCDPTVEISNDERELTHDEFRLVWTSVRRDHTEQFWMGSSYTPYVYPEDNIVAKVDLTYLMTGDALAAAKVEFEQAIGNFIGRLDSNMSQYDMEKALLEMLVPHVTYTDGRTHSRNAYGALVEGKAVCEGYAEALQCLLQRVGIQSVEVFGYGINPSTGSGENHAWNIVRIDGKYYITDPTWSDGEKINMLLYAYFNQTDAVFSLDHQTWPTNYDPDSGETLQCAVYQWPACTSTEANYFTKEGIRITTYTVNSIANLLKENDLCARFFVDSDLETFRAWYSANIGAIAQAAGVTVSYSYSVDPIVAGREAYIYLETCEHPQSALTLIPAKPATCEEDGNVAYYVCQQKGCGKLFADADAMTEIKNKNNVIVFSKGHDFTVKTESEETLIHKAEKCTEHDTYKLTCSVCGERSETYTFQTDVIGAHAYADTWVADGAKNHKRVCAYGCGIDITEAHTSVSSCDVCGYKFSVTDLIPEGIDGEAGANAIIDFVLANPLILGGGGGGVVLLIIIIAIVRRARS